MLKAVPLIFVLATAIFLTLSQHAMAELSYDDKLAFADHLEETLGHIWAVEKNLDDHNAELALVHATHPIAELYDLMKPDLQAKDPDLDNQVKQVLLDLGKKTGKDVTRQDAQKAIDQAKDVVEIARITIIGADLSNDTSFKLRIMQDLLETSKVEYKGGVSSGQIKLMPEFQDGSAFVWRSQQIYDTVKSEIPQDESQEIGEFYDDLWQGYEKKMDPAEIAIRSDAIIHKIDTVLGVESKPVESVDYVGNVKSLLQQSKDAYAAGNTEEAQMLVSKAYLDNFEHLEGDLAEQNPELKSEMEQMMRIELRNMIKDGAPVADVNAHIDKIILKMDDVAKVVPEFPFGAIIAMATVVGMVITITKLRSIKPSY